MKLKLILSFLLLPFSAMAATNQFSNVLVNDTLISSNTFVRGYFGMMTNGPLTGTTIMVLRPRDATPTINQIDLLADGVGNTAAIRMGDFTLGPVLLLGTDGAGSTRWNNDAVLNAKINVEGQNVITMDENGIILNNASSDSITFNGSTWTTAHPVTLNGGVLSWDGPGATVSNNTSFASVNSHIASNALFTSSLTVGSNATVQGATSFVQGTGTNIAFAIRHAATGVQNTMTIAGTNGLALFGWSPGGIFSFASPGSGFSTLSVSLLSLAGNAIVRTGSSSSTLSLTGGAGAGGDVIFQPSVVERGRFSTNGLVLGTNAQPGAVGIIWWGATNFVFTPGTVASLATAVTNMSMTGARSGFVTFSGTTSIRAGLVPYVACTNDGVITYLLFNGTLAGIDPGSHTVRVRQTQAP